jgi:hypothetical protein
MKPTRNKNSWETRALTEASWSGPPSRYAKSRARMLFLSETWITAAPGDVFGWDENTQPLEAVIPPGEHSRVFEFGEFRGQPTQFLTG